MGLASIGWLLSCNSIVAMTKLFLCASFADTADLFAQHYTSLQGKRVAFIPTASIHEAYVGYVEAARCALMALGLIIEEVELSLRESADIVATINSCDFIYVSGGNTFFLLNELRRKCADITIMEHIRQGKLYIGESAGAMICAPCVDYVKLMDDYAKLTPNFRDFKGLEVIDFYPVPHYNEWPFVAATQSMVQHFSHLPLCLMANHQAIVVQGKAIECLG